MSSGKSTDYLRWIFLMDFKHTIKRKSMKKSFKEKRCMLQRKAILHEQPLIFQLLVALKIVSVKVKVRKRFPRYYSYCTEKKVNAWHPLTWLLLIVLPLGAGLIEFVSETIDTFFHLFEKLKTEKS